MRAALLPHPADPFLLKYWLKFYTNVWHDEVDKLYICINSPMEKTVIDYMLTLTAKDPSIEVIYLDKQIEHGAAIDLLLTYCHESMVMLVEDDGFIFGKGAVSESFGYLERNEFDIVGSPRGSCSQEIWDRAKELYGLDYSGYGDVGPNFWPNFFFTSKKILEATDRNFGARQWVKGDKIAALGDYMAKDTIASDTFVNTSLQLRAKNYRIHTQKQDHGGPMDLEEYANKQWLFDGKARWIHVGSLSSGTHGVLMDDKGRPLARRFIDEPKNEARLGDWCNTDGERKEWERRVAFWELFYDNSDPEAIPEFRKLYREAIDRVIRQYALQPKQINQRKAVYHTLGL